MANMVKWIEELVMVDDIEAVVIGGYNQDWSNEGREGSNQTIGQVLTWKQARPMLDYEFDDGLGGADCNSLLLWTFDRVWFVHEYDGATSLAWVPRQPCACMPEFSGLGSP